MRWLDSIADSVDMNLTNSRRWWKAEESGVLQSMGLQSQTRPSNLTTLGLVVGFVGVITCVKLLVSIC